MPPLLSSFIFLSSPIYFHLPFATLPSFFLCGTARMTLTKNKSENHAKVIRIKKKKNKAQENIFHP